jgi:hypothetical protein
LRVRHVTLDRCLGDAQRLALPPADVIAAKSLRRIIYCAKAAENAIVGALTASGCVTQANNSPCLADCIHQEIRLEICLPNADRNAGHFDRRSHSSHVDPRA